jgi:conjugal transfer pilus assembly protein TraI
MLRRALKSILPKRGINTPTLSDIPRYPPYATGLPAVPVKDLINSQDELIQKIYNTTRYDRDNFEQWYLPAIELYAELVHLLPASEGHHHRGVGGLFRHGLEVGLYALDKITNYGGNLAMDKVGLQRRRAIPRWELGCFLAALNHDAGKVLSDLRVTGPGDKGVVWSALDVSIPAWMRENRFDRYFVSFQKTRSHKDHEAMTSLLIDKLVPVTTRKYLLEVDNEILQKVIEAFCGHSRGPNIIHDYVVEADQKSVEFDLRKNQFTDSISGDVGVPIERNLFDAMRRLVSNGTWKVNSKGDRLWVMQGELHIAWNKGCEDILALLHKDGIQGIPRDPATLADILLDRDLAVPFVHEGQRQRYWRIAPEILQERGSVVINALRLKNPETLLDLIPGDASGEVNGVNLTSPENAETNEEPVSASDNDDPQGSVGTQTESDTEAKEEQSSEQPPEETQDQPVSPEAPRNVDDAPNDATAEIILPGQIEKNPPKAQPKKKNKKGGSTKERQRATAQLVPDGQAQKVEHSLSGDAKQSYEKATEFLEGSYCGTVLHAIAENLALGWAKWGKDVLQHEGKVALRYPNAFEDTGCDPNVLMEQLDKEDWLERHPEHFLRKIQDIKGFGRALVITEMVSESFLIVAKAPAHISKNAAAVPEKKGAQRDCQIAAQSEPRPAAKQVAANKPADQGSEKLVAPVKSGKNDHKKTQAIQSQEKPKISGKLDISLLNSNQIEPATALYNALNGTEDCPIELVEINGKKYFKRALAMEWLRETQKFGTKRSRSSIESGCFDIVVDKNIEYVGLK